MAHLSFSTTVAFLSSSSFLREASVVSSLIFPHWYACLPVCACQDVCVRLKNETPGMGPAGTVFRSHKLMHAQIWLKNLLKVQYQHGFQNKGTLSSAVKTGVNRGSFSRCSLSHMKVISNTICVLKRFIFSLSVSFVCR